jgi:hypothetical protein
MSRTVRIFATFVCCAMVSITGQLNASWSPRADADSVTDDGHAAGYATDLHDHFVVVATIVLPDLDCDSTENGIETRVGLRAEETQTYGMVLLTSRCHNGLPTHFGSFNFSDGGTVIAVGRNLEDRDHIRVACRASPEPGLTRLRVENLTQGWRRGETVHTVHLDEAFVWQIRDKDLGGWRELLSQNTRVRDVQFGGRPLAKAHAERTMLFEDPDDIMVRPTRISHRTDFRFITVE